jgi:hypothetical protein
MIRVWLSTGIFLCAKRSTFIKIEKISMPNIYGKGG